MKYTKRELKWTRLKLKNVMEYADMADELIKDLKQEIQELKDENRRLRSELMSVR